MTSLQPSTDPLVDALSGFACPLEPMNTPVRQAITGEYARGYLTAFLGRYGNSLGSHRNLLIELASCDIPYELAWHWSFGRIRRAVLTPVGDPIQVAACLAEHIQAPAPSGTIRTLTGTDATYVEPFDDDPLPSPWTAAQIDARCRDALELLQRYSPRYLKWVQDATRFVLPRDGSDGFMRSASSLDWPGVISASFPSSAAALAEMLVHESSHQHLNIVRRLGPVVNGEDDSMYHSPLKGTERPIGAILVAFHAVANMLLFYRDCVEANIRDDGYCEVSLRRHEPDAVLMAEHLTASSGLTPIGRVVADRAAHHLQFLRT